MANSKAIKEQLHAAYQRKDWQYLRSRIRTTPRLPDYSASHLAKSLANFSKSVSKAMISFVEAMHRVGERTEMLKKL